MSDTNTTPRPWSPTAPSLLWAHEFRRENIHLLNQLDTTRSNLASTTTALEALKQTVSALETVVQGLRARDENENNQVDHASEELKKRVTKLKEGVNARFTAVEDVIDSVKGENCNLRNTLDEVRGRWEGVEGHCEKIREGMREELGAFVKEVVAREIEALRSGLRCDGCRVGRDANMEAKDTDIVPDSMPRERQGLPGQDNDVSLQTLSQSTLGSSNFSDARDEQPAHGPPETELDEDEYRMIKQNGRSLLGYFALTEAGRGQLPPRKREGKIVEAFVAGLDDADTRVLVERHLDANGWMWNVLATVVQRIVREQGQTAQTDQPQAKRKSKKRRCIPIVPVDEEDLLYS